MCFPEQELEMLVISVRESTKGHLRDLCTSLLSNPFEGLMSHQHIHTNESTQRRLLLELLVHAIAVFHSGSRLLYPLHLVASRPQTIIVRKVFPIPAGYRIQLLSEKDLRSVHKKKGRKKKMNINILYLLQNQYK